MEKPNVNQEGALEAEIAVLKFVALKFVKVINAGDSKGLTELQAEDFTFTDMAGDITRGRQGWQDYFSAYPEYTIHVQHVLTGGNGVAIIGKTTGSHVPPKIEEKWNILWTAEIRDDLVAEWRIYSDIEDVRKTLRGETPQVTDDLSPVNIALKFVKVINAGDSEGLTELQAEDFTLIDSSGDVVRGRQGWQDYFSAYPEYTIHVQHVLTGGNGVAIIGKTTGSQVPPDIEKREVVLWTAEIRDGLVAEWRLYTSVDEAR